LNAQSILAILAILGTKSKPPLRDLDDFTSAVWLSLVQDSGLSDPVSRQVWRSGFKLLIISLADKRVVSLSLRDELSSFKSNAAVNNDKIL